MRSLDISRGQQDMVEDMDVRRAADIYIRRYRENAALYATHKGNMHLQRGDANMAAMWDRICAAIVEQLNAEQR